MNDSDRRMLRHFHATVAMHALITSGSYLGSVGSVQAAGAISPVQLVDSAFAIADAMIEKGGPIE
jgi:hypothetical protein